MRGRDELVERQRGQEQLPSEVLGVGLVVREVGVDEFLGVCQEEVVTELWVPGA